MSLFDLLFQVFAWPYYPASIMFFVVAVRALFWRIRPNTYLVLGWGAFAILPSLLAFGFGIYDLVRSSKYDQHWTAAIVFTYAGIGILINLLSSILYAFYLVRRKTVRAG